MSSQDYFQCSQYLLPSDQAGERGGLISTDSGTKFYGGFGLSVHFYQFGFGTFLFFCVNLSPFLVVYWSLCSHSLLSFAPFTVHLTCHLLLMPARQRLFTSKVELSKETLHMVHK